MPVRIRSRGTPYWTRVALVSALCAAVVAGPAAARSEGGLYVVGYGFDFEEVARRAIEQNADGRRFFVLVLPEQARALQVDAPRALAAARERVVAADGVLLVCRRDIEERRIDPATLVPRVVAVRGWPSPGGTAMPPGQRHFAGEDPAALPASDSALRRLRATCS